MEKCSDLLYTGLRQIAEDKPWNEIKKFFDKVKQHILYGDCDLNESELLTFYHFHSKICLYFDQYSEAEYYARRAIGIEKRNQDYDHLASTGSVLLDTLNATDRPAEAIRISGELLDLCKDSERLHELKASLCISFYFRGWVRKASDLAKEVIEFRKKHSTYDYYSSRTCTLYRIRYEGTIRKAPISLINEWYSLERIVHGADSGCAMEVYLEKAIQLAIEGNIPEALNMCKIIIPVLEKEGLNYSSDGLGRSYSFYADLLNDSGEKEMALEYFRKSKDAYSLALGSNNEYVKRVEGKILELASLSGGENSNE